MAINDETTDAALLTRFTTAGDGRAFAALVERYGGMVMGICRRTAGHEQDAEDAFQATFLVLARRAGAIRRQESVGPWLYGVANRIGRQAQEIEHSRAGLQATLDDALAAGPMADEADDLRPLLDEVVNRLPPRFREPIVLCYFQGQSADAVARLLGCARGTVLSRLSRARDRLRAVLTRRGVALSTAALTAALTGMATAAVPLPLAYSTIQAATPAAGGAMSARAAVLAKGVLTTMWIAKVVRLTAVTTALVLGVAGLVATQVWADKPPAKKDKDAKANSLEGTWQVTAITKNGAEAPKDEVEQIKLVFSGESFTLQHGGAEMKGTFKADSTQKPATIDIEVTEGAEKGDSQLAIYELDGDTLRICTAHKGTARPDKFEAPEGSSLALITLKRVKN